MRHWLQRDPNAILSFMPIMLRSFTSTVALAWGPLRAATTEQAVVKIINFAQQPDWVELALHASDKAPAAASSPATRS